jgi:hypothetical protein
MEKYLNNFSLWCEECVKITDKMTGLPVPFKLNSAQRRVAELMEKQRRSRQPIRLIILKARQWGSSTLIQAYMAWIQLVVREGWHSLTVAHLKDAASVIRGTYTQLLAYYPDKLKEGNGWKLVPYEKTSGVSFIPARGCRLAISTSLSPDAVRGSSFFMAHLSEAAFWGEGVNNDESASSLVRTVSGSVPMSADTLVVIESTANGRNNFFYREWQRACRGESDKQPIFVPWHEIEIYRKQLQPGEFEHLLPELDDYERKLLDDGVLPSAVAWYHDKRKEYERHEDMMAEFPSYPHEAFAGTRKRVFDEISTECLADSEESFDCNDYRVVLVAATGKREHRYILCGRQDDKICVLQDYSEKVGLGELMIHISELCSRYGASLLIANSTDEYGVSHGRWCLRKAHNMSIRLCYSPDEPIIDLTGETLIDAIDIHKQHLSDGKIAERNKDIHDEYIDFSTDKSYAYPGVLCRLAASVSYCDEMDSKRLEIADFL